MVSSPTIARSARTLPVVRGEAALAVVIALALGAPAPAFAAMGGMGGSV